MALDRHVSDAGVTDDDLRHRAIEPPDLGLVVLDDKILRPGRAAEYVRSSQTQHDQLRAQHAKRRRHDQDLAMGFQARLGQPEVNELEMPGPLWVTCAHRGSDLLVKRS